VSRDILELPAPAADARLPYGPERLHFGDLRLPETSGPHPVAVVLHGGFWRNRYGLDYMGHVCAALTAEGVATWNVEYRRIGDEGGGWPGTFLDVGLATDYLRDLAPTHDLDLRRVVTVGHSAGGHLALWLAGRHRIPAGDPLAARAPLPIRGVVSLAGVTDPQRAWELGLSDSVVETFMGGSPERHPERYATASPAELLPLGVAQVLVHGTADENVPFELSRDYQVAAVARGDEATLLALDAAGHFEPVDPRSEAWPLVAEVVLSHLRGG